MSWWSQYPAGSLGRVLHFIYEYCGFKYAEIVTIGEREIHYYGEKFAEIIEWKDVEIHEQKINVPIFKFILDDRNYFTEQQELKMRCAIMALVEMREKLKEKWMPLYRKEMDDRTKAVNEKYGYKGGENETDNNHYHHSTGSNGL